MKKKLILNIGVPCTGKTTTLEKRGGEKVFFVINRDDIATQVAEKNGYLYHETFALPKPIESVGEIHEKYGKINRTSSDNLLFPEQKIYSNIYKLNLEIDKVYREKIKEAINQDKDIVIDRTNINASRRKEFLDLFKEIGGEEVFDDISIKALVFDFYDIEDVKKMNDYRIKTLEKQGVSKVIPSEVIEKIAKDYERPLYEEGFDEIEVINIYENKSEKKKIKTSNTKQKQGM